MYGKWLRSRDFSRSILEPRDATDLRDTISRFVESRNVEPCVFVGPDEHWLPSITYSIEGERGYTLWGDSRGRLEGGAAPAGELPFNQLIARRYFSSYLGTGGDGPSPALNELLLGLFYVNRRGVVGFGVVTDIDFDFFRNFYGWGEEEGRFWLTRFRIKVVYLERSVLENPYDPSRWSGRDVDVTIRSNQCFNDENVKEKILGYLRSVLENPENLRATMEFYGRYERGTAGTGRAGACGTDEKLYFEDKDLEDEVRRALRSSNVMIIGPPGVGKTQLARRATSGGSCDVVTANSLWFRRDVIGGETLRGNSVAWKSGFLLRAYNAAAELPEGAVHHLIIDEINRADVDKAFGEFLTIFSSAEPESWSIPRSLVDEIRSYKDVDDVAEKFLSNYESQGDAPLRRLRIIATMNVTDIRNLFLLGQALMRRFLVIRIDCPTREGAEGVKEVEKVVDFLCERLGVKDEGIRKLITDSANEVIEAVRNRAKDVDFCLSPASLRRAIAMFMEGEDRSERRFLRYLKYSLGYMNLEEDVVRAIDELIEKRTEGGRGAGG